MNSGEGQLASTSRLMLRAFRPSDLDLFSEIVGDPRVMALVGDNKPLSRERAQTWLNNSIRRWELSEPATYAVCLKSNGTLVGYGGFTRRQDEPTEFEIIYGLAKHTWRQGLGFEAAVALVEIAFSGFSMRRLWATVDPENDASIRILRRLGMDHIQDRVDENGLPEQLFRLDLEPWKCKAANP